MLEKIAEATEATLQKIDKADTDKSKASSKGDELVKLGVKLLSESLGRTTQVARRSADEAIGAAMKAFELSQGLAAADVEARKEKERMDAKKKGFDEDTAMPAGDVDRTSGGDDDSKAREGSDKKSSGEQVSAGTPKESSNTPSSKAGSKDPLKCAEKRLKDRHVALRVKNLKFLATLNEEALRMQGRLWSLLERSAGALLPDVSISQKSRIFELVAQLLDSSLSECSRLTANPATSAPKILERCLAFALALEHTKEIAMPSDSRTQALKLAALIDNELLCQIIDGPFKRRLLAVGARRKQTESDRTSVGPGRQRRLSLSRNSRGSVPQAQQPGGQSSPSGASMGWDDAVQSTCGRFVQGLRRVVVGAPGSDANSS
jgi:hypothetical protein